MDTYYPNTWLVWRPINDADWVTDTHILTFGKKSVAVPGLLAHLEISSSGRDNELESVKISLSSLSHGVLVVFFARVNIDKL